LNQITISGSVAENAKYVEYSRGDSVATFTILNQHDDYGFQKIFVVGYGYMAGRINESVRKGAIVVVSGCLVTSEVSDTSWVKAENVSIELPAVGRRK